MKLRAEMWVLRSKWQVLAVGLLGAEVVIILSLYLMSATANSDDLLAFVHVAPELKTFKGAVTTLKTVFLNEDVGRTELRTYGLARFLQISHLWLFGKSAVAIFVTMLMMHVASAVLLFCALKKVLAQHQVRVIVALIWLVSPAVLPVERTFHHFLYTMLPYYLLICWVAVVPGRSDRTLAGALLLIAVSLSGEAAIPVSYLTVVLFAARSWRKAERDVVQSIIKQMIIASLLLIVYVVYQRLAIYDSSLPQRVNVGLTGTFSEIGQRFVATFGMLGQSILALAGQPFFDAELGRQSLVGGLSYLNHWVFWLTTVVAIFSFAILLFPLHLEKTPQKWSAAVAIILVAASPLTLYLVVFIVTGQLPLTIRYVPPIFTAALVGLPLALLLIVPRLGTVVAGATAVLCLGASMGLSVEIYGVRKRIEDRLAWVTQQTLSGRDVVLIAHISPAIGSTTIPFGVWPGLGGAFDYFVSDPFRSFWTTNPFLITAAGVRFVALDYREIDNETIELFDGLQKLVTTKDKVAVGGLVSPNFPSIGGQVMLYRDWSEYAASRAAKIPERK